jgi:signal transduction histidine kinase
VEAADGDGVRFAIEDHGPGIPADKVDIVFDKFTKLNMFTEGLGIGLYLCRRIVNLMGGTLTLDTQYAGGSRFVIAIG